MSQPELSFLQRRAIVPSLAITGDVPNASAPTTAIQGDFPTTIAHSFPTTFAAGVSLNISGLPQALGRGGPPVHGAIVQAQAPPLVQVQIPAPAPVDPDTPDLDNVQGDVYFMFPKKWERFLFFTIENIPDFRTKLATYADEITTSRKTVDNIRHIDTHRGSGRRDIVSTGIAFTRAGLCKLGYTRKLQDPHFDKGPQYLEKTELGDKGTYHPPLDRGRDRHGVILLTAGAQEKCREEMERMKGIFGTSINEVHTYEGRVRVGHGEHFGWKDGISQPALDKWCIPKQGQRLVKPGVIIMGYPGDPVCDDRSLQQRPAWTKDGSFMVFRKLEQNVLFFEDYIEKNWRSIPVRPTGLSRDLTDDQRQRLFGARLFGRFKSGVPLALSPYIEDRHHLRPESINNFDYTGPTGVGCPFSAHIRKTEPRNLLPFVSKEYLDASVIVRAGIPYGDDITDTDRTRWGTLTDEAKENDACLRGLLFVCYQSSIDNGFYRQTTGFANNDYFPLTSLAPKKIGQDPIIGGPQPVHLPPGQTNITEEGQVTLELINAAGDKFEVNGLAQKVDTSLAPVEQKFFATSRGGEYFFVPSISTVKDVFTQAPA